MYNSPVHPTNTFWHQNTSPRSAATHLVPGAAPIKWVGELDEEVVAEGERFPLFLADWTAAVRAGAFGGAWAADAGERARSRARSRPAGGGDDVWGLGRLDTSGGVPEAARMPFFFWRTLAMVCGQTACAVSCPSFPCVEKISAWPPEIFLLGTQ